MLQRLLSYSGGVNDASQPSSPRRFPAPPGGHALRIDHSKTVRPDADGRLSRSPVIDEFSAGGLVINTISGEFHAAIIARRNRAGRLEWCLPKGHLEGNETPAEAAVREISEETGILGEIRKPLGTIDYWFTGEGRRIHKMVHHFLLEMTGGYLTVDNDPDREAEDVDWLPTAELFTRLAYPNERRLAAQAHSQLMADPSILQEPGR